MAQHRDIRCLALLCAIVSYAPTDGEWFEGPSLKKLGKILKIRDDRTVGLLVDELAASGCVETRVEKFFNKKWTSRRMWLVVRSDGKPDYIPMSRKWLYDHASLGANGIGLFLMYETMAGRRRLFCAEVRDLVSMSGLCRNTHDKYMRLIEQHGLIETRPCWPEVEIAMRQNMRVSQNLQSNPATLSQNLHPMISQNLRVIEPFTEPKPYTESKAKTDIEPDTHSRKNHDSASAPIPVFNLLRMAIESRLTVSLKAFDKQTNSRINGMLCKLRKEHLEAFELALDARLAARRENNAFRIEPDVTFAPARLISLVGDACGDANPATGLGRNELGMPRWADGLTPDELEQRHWYGEPKPNKQQLTEYRDALLWQMTRKTGQRFVDQNLQRQVDEILRDVMCAGMSVDDFENALADEMYERDQETVTTGAELLYILRRATGTPQPLDEFRRTLAWHVTGKDSPHLAAPELQKRINQLLGRLPKDVDLDDFDEALGNEMLDLDNEHGSDYRITSGKELLDLLQLVIDELSGNNGRFPPRQWPAAPMGATC